MSTSPQSPSLPKIDRRWIWMFVGLASWGLHKLLCANPSFTEIAYSQGLFPLLRIVYDYTLGWSPIPMVYLLLLGLIGWRGWKWWKNRKNRVKRPFRNRLASFGLNLLAFSGGVVALFYWSWGYNYCRNPLEEQVGFSVGQVDSLTIDREFEIATAEAIAARELLSGAGTKALTADFFPTELENEMRESLKIVLREMNYPAPGRVRGRKLYPKGLLMQLGASGIYIPFVAEGHIDAALEPVSQPFTLAHELGHGYGFGDEGTCNFLGYLACLQSEDPVIRYAGYLAYWRETALLYRRLHPEEYLELRAALPSGMIADIDAINAVLRKYPGFFPTFSTLFYNSYLKSQGVEEGVVSYSRVVAMVTTWRRKAPK